MKKMIFFLALAFISVIGFVSYRYTYAMPVRRSGEKKKVNKSEIDNYRNKIAKKLEYEEILKRYPIKNKKIVNILLVGVDSIDSTKGRSDAMMILTLDKKNNKMKLTSLMRDTYVNISGHGKEKLNHSYAYGGINLLKETIENTFKIKIDNHAIINFAGFEEVVDIIGGVKVYVDEEEEKYIKKYIDSLHGKNHYLEELIQVDSINELSGELALAYSRIRYTKSGSYGRTERQREVISGLKDSIKDVSILKYPELIKVCAGLVKTDMSLFEILDYGNWVMKNKDKDFQKFQIPKTDLSIGKIINKKTGWVLVMKESENIKALNDFIYGY